MQVVGHFCTCAREYSLSANHWDATPNVNIRMKLVSLAINTTILILIYLCLSLLETLRRPFICAHLLALYLSLYVGEVLP